MHAIYLAVFAFSLAVQPALVNAETLTITSGSYSAFQDFAASIAVRGADFSITQSGGGDCCGGVLLPESAIPASAFPGEVLAPHAAVIFAGGLNKDDRLYRVSGLARTTVPPVPASQRTVAPFTLRGSLLARPLSGGEDEHFEILGAGTQTLSFRATTRTGRPGEIFDVLIYESTRLDFAPIPEPSSVVLLMSGVLLLISTGVRARQR